MSPRSRSLLAGLGIVAVLATADAAQAYWVGLGSGSGSGVAATMPAGNQPAATATGQSVTVSWPQSSFRGSPLGTFAGGGYTLTRYASGGSTPLAPAAGCATTIAGAAATLQCVEAGVPYGVWQYGVTPVLGTFTGAPSAKSANVSVAPPAPTLSTATAQNPAAGQATGDIQLSWTAVTGASGYDVFRRSGGAYDFGAPLNGATPVSGTTFSDPGAGLAAATTYQYVVRALAGSPAAASASSNERSATTISRPAAPTGVTATAARAARVDVGWSSIAGVAGYNVYRRTDAGTFNFSTPLNGATPVAGLTLADLTAVDATTYRYVVRAVIAGAGGAQVESASSTESGAVTADGVAPPAPSAVTVTSGGPVWGASTCGVAAGTRYVNSAGVAAMGVSAAITAPEPGETVVFSASSGAMTSVTVAATTTTVNGALVVTSLTDGALTVTARTKDLAGNLSATRAPTNAIVKDTGQPALTADYNPGLLGILLPSISGAAECGASVHIVKTSGGSGTWDPTVGSSSPWSFSVSSGLLGLGSVSFDVTATDRAGNTRTISIS